MVFFDAFCINIRNRPKRTPLRFLKKKLALFVFPWYSAHNNIVYFPVGSWKQLFQVLSFRVESSFAGVLHFFYEPEPTECSRCGWIRRSWGGQEIYLSHRIQNRRWRNVGSRYFFISSSWYPYSLHHSAEGLKEKGQGRQQEGFLSFCWGGAVRTQAGQPFLFAHRICVTAHAAASRRRGCGCCS